jgi:hypothetical protein
MAESRRWRFQLTAPAAWPVRHIRAKSVVFALFGSAESRRWRFQLTAPAAWPVWHIRAKSVVFALLVRDGCKVC